MGAISLTFHYNIYDFYKKVLNLRYVYLFQFKIVCVFVDLKNGRPSCEEFYKFKRLGCYGILTGKLGCIHKSVEDHNLVTGALSQNWSALFHLAY